MTPVKGSLIPKGVGEPQADTCCSKQAYGYGAHQANYDETRFKDLKQKLKMSLPVSDHGLIIQGFMISMTL